MNTQRPLALFRRPAGLRLLLGVFILSRLALLLWNTPRVIGLSQPSDLRYMLGMAQFSDRGLYPYLGFWMEYPPLYPWLTVLVYRLGRCVVGTAAIEAWFYGVMAALMILCEAGVFLLLHRIALQLYGPQLALRSTALYLLLTVPGYVVAGWFDPLPTLLLLAGLYFLLNGRALPSGLMVGLGFVTKLFPAVLLPVALAVARGWRARLGYLSAVVGVIGSVWLPFLLASPSMFLASLRNQLGRSSWETIWALLDGYYGYGKVASLAEHLDASKALAANHFSELPWGEITLLFGVAYLVLYRRIWRARQPREIVAGTALTLLWLLLYSKGYSPQYLMWIAPLLVVLLPNRRGALYLGGLSLINLVELPVYFSFFPWCRVLLVLSVLLRTALLAAATGECLRLVAERVPRPVKGFASARHTG